jgi:BolA protein
MKPDERIKIITERLQQHFSPAHLDVIDDSHKHVGHAGAQGGAGHYTVVISSSVFHGKTRIESHREIYHVLNDLIPSEVHALKIIIK